VALQSTTRVRVGLVALIGIALVLSGCGIRNRREFQELTRRQVQGQGGARVASSSSSHATSLAPVEYKVKVVKDIQYYKGPDADPKKSKLDLYLPEGLDSFPVLHFVHGGAWTMGDKDQSVPLLGSYKKLGTAFAREGIGVVISNYRLSPKVKHPTHIRDVAAAWAWIYRNIATHGGRTNEMFVMGQSAGGHLAALLTMNRKYLDVLGVPSNSIRGLIAMSGIYDVKMSKEKGKAPSMITKAFGNDPAVWKAASPLMYVRRGLPPVLVLTAERDPMVLRIQGEQLSVALKQKNVETDFIILPGKNHFNEVGDIGKKGDLATAEIVSFIRSNLR